MGHLKTVYKWLQAHRKQFFIGQAVLRKDYEKQKYAYSYTDTYRTTEQAKRGATDGGSGGMPRAPRKFLKNKCSKIEFLI